MVPTEHNQYKLYRHFQSYSQREHPIAVRWCGLRVGPTKRCALGVRAGNVDAEVVSALEETLRNIRKIRYPHRKVTEYNFNLRADGSVGNSQISIT